MWAVEQRVTGAFVGTIGFAEPEGWPGFELAWILARRWWGQGFATEGARAALAHAFDVLGQDRVISLIDPANRASIRVAERIGECLLGRTVYALGERLCYGIDRERYAARGDILFHPCDACRSCGPNSEFASHRFDPQVQFSTILGDR